MSSTTVLTDSAAPRDDFAEYRSMSTAAVVGLILGGLSILTAAAGANSLEASFLTAPVPLIGIIVSLRALAAIRRMPNELAGRKIALAGLMLSASFLVGGIGFGAYVSATEVPTGYERLTFDRMRTNALQQERGVAVPPEVVKLDGEKVFI